MGKVPAGTKLGPEFSSSSSQNQQLFVLSVWELQSLSWLVLEPLGILAQKLWKMKEIKGVALSDLSLHALSDVFNSALTPYFW